MKKADLAITTVIIAALALLVLVVLALIFTGKIRIFGTQTRSCTNIGGDCEAEGCEPNEVVMQETSCASYCCVDTFSSPTDNTR